MFLHSRTVGICFLILSNFTVRGKIFDWSVLQNVVICESSAKWPSRDPQCIRTEASAKTTGAQVTLHEYQKLCFLINRVCCTIWEDTVCLVNVSRNTDGTIFWTVHTPSLCSFCLCILLRHVRRTLFSSYTSIGSFPPYSHISKQTNFPSNFFFLYLYLEKHTDSCTVFVLTSHKIWTASAATCPIITKKWKTERPSEWFFLL